MTAITHPKKRGEWVETLFLTRAVSLGLAISKPWGDCLRYDFIIDAGGRLFRIQVKGTSCRSSRSAYVCSVTTCTRLNARTVPYTSDEVDFFALYIIPEDIWYIVPVSEVTSFKSAKPVAYSAYLNPKDPNNRYDHFREAWHLLGA